MEIQKYRGLLVVIPYYQFIRNIWSTTKKQYIVYYFVDATCENCLLKPGSAPGNYWLVTRKTFQTDMINEDSILLSFKEVVKKQYPLLTDSYLYTTVIRWQDSFSAITTSFENKKKKMVEKYFKEVKIE